ncbi:uncharacterized protein [Dermacentor albipictus]|uniref:uncharacterized protein n=1 Tax=Dermacentor albipictus TaxID=60249 RepID=UPI0038FC618F
MNLSRMQAAKERNKRASARHSQVCAGATFKTKRVPGHNSIPHEDQMEVEQSSHEATRESGAAADTIHKEEDAVEALLQLAASGNDKNQAEKSVQVDSLSIEIEMKHCLGSIADVDVPIVAV